MSPHISSTFDVDSFCRFSHYLSSRVEPALQWYGWPMILNVRGLRVFLWLAVALWMTSRDRLALDPSARTLICVGLVGAAAIAVVLAVRRSGQDAALPKWMRRRLPAPPRDRRRNDA